MAENVTSLQLQIFCFGNCAYTFCLLFWSCCCYCLLETHAVAFCLPAQPKFHCTHPTGLLCNAKLAKILAPDSFVAQGRYVGKAVHYAHSGQRLGTHHTAVSTKCLLFWETTLLQVHMHPLSVFAIEFHLPEQQSNAAVRILYYGFHTPSMLY